MILLTVILLSSWCLVQGDYKCICNYNVEKNVLSQASANADVIGYMYEFDCKPEAGSSGDDAWLAVAFEHKVGYVQKDPQIQIQTCPGSIPDQDKLPPETTTTTSTVFTTTAAPETTTTTMSQTTNYSISTTVFETTVLPINSTQQLTTEPSTEPTTEPTTEPATEPSTVLATEPSTELTSEPTTETTTELTTEPATGPPTEITTEQAAMLAITYTTPSETTVLELTTTSSPASSSTPYYDTTTSKPITTTTTTHIPTTFSTASPPSSSTPRPTTSSTSTTNAPTATSVLQGHTELCPDNVIQHSHRIGSILNQYGDKCYEVVQSGVSWSHAEANCKTQGGHLAHIANQQEQDFVYHFLVKIHSHTVWIGLHDRNQEEHFEWSSGDPVTYENWMPGRKDFLFHGSEDCVFMTPYSGQWDDARCSGDNPFSVLIPGTSHAYICQYATEIPTTIGSITVPGGNVAQGFISLCPNHVRQQAIQDNGIIGQYNHNCYELISQSNYPWNYAESICESRGGHLAHIQNQQEQDYLQGFLQQHLPRHAVWIGLSDQQTEEYFQWSSHDKVVYTNWVPGHTSNFVSHHDEDCVVMIPYKGGQWDDIPCGHVGAISGQFYGETHPLICQYNTVTETSLVG